MGRGRGGLLNNLEHDSNDSCILHLNTVFTYNVSTNFVADCLRQIFCAIAIRCSFKATYLSIGLHLFICVIIKKHFFLIPKKLGTTNMQSVI